ncbi:MAG TPA: SusC/RagA family TonB-linked outer membrane protein, partial [Bacteroidales bacterium]|nr:SusC/RagA family TonB-linked outer membrane protein [Bacteroidales bacterium]
MENSHEKTLHFVSDRWIIPLIMSKMRIVLFIIFLALLSAGTALADEPGQQQQTVSGVVKDAASGEALTGVSVVVKGTTLGALTDLEGKFSIPVSTPQVTLMFSFIGYTPQEINAAPGTQLNITLALEVKQIQEVVVVGYGTQKKESVVGAITQVNNVALVKSGISNVTNAISGKLSGVLTIQQTGEPGNSGSEIIVRGLSSWNGSQPLVLVDGVERDFKGLDPNEIASISVLKDASATAVFGAKGANGVIIVTTKRGTFGAPVMNMSASYGINKATRIPEFIDSYETMKALNVGLMNNQQFDKLVSEYELGQYKNPSTPLNALRYPNVDWFKELTLPWSPTVDANFNISGGTKFVKYFGTLGYVNENTFFKGYVDGYNDTRYKYDRFNYRTNLDFNLTNTTTLS